MRLKRPALACITLCLLLGCRPESAPPAASSQPPAAEATSGAPMEVSVRQVHGPATTLLITVTRRMPAAFDLSITLPKGVRLVSGLVHEHVEAQGPGPLTRQVTIDFDGVPTEDVVVEAVSRSEGFGARATDAFRFGRAAPKLPALPRAGEIRVPGKSLGQPVDLGR